jgi:hypothetical protein
MIGIEEGEGIENNGRENSEGAREGGKEGKFFFHVNEFRLSTKYSMHISETIYET